MTFLDALKGEAEAISDAAAKAKDEDKDFLEETAMVVATQIEEALFQAYANREGGHGIFNATSAIKSF